MTFLGSTFDVDIGNSERTVSSYYVYVETFTEGGGFVSKHLGIPLLSTGRSDPLISYGQTK